MASGDLAAMVWASSHCCGQRLREAKIRLIRPIFSASLASTCCVRCKPVRASALADQVRQALQGADVGDHAEVDFLDRNTASAEA
jgi:hypothetical protein